MTTFQAAVYGFIQGFSEFLPISASAHRALLAYFLGWPEPTGAFAGALALGALLSVLVYFIHDWASMASCFLQVILFRKKPMTLDERMPIFLLIATAPLVGAYLYFHERLAAFTWTPALVAGALAAFSIPLWVSDSLSRRNKGMFDWTWLDALIIGVFQCLSLIPGFGRMAAALPGAFVRNYNREAAAKFVFYASMPVLAGSAYLNLHAARADGGIPGPDLSWLSFGVGLVIAFFAGLLAIGGFMKHVQRRGMGQYVGYRFLLAAAAGIVIWVRTRG